MVEDIDEDVDEGVDVCGKVRFEKVSKRRQKLSESLHRPPAPPSLPAFTSRAFFLINSQRFSE